MKLSYVNWVAQHLWSGSLYKHEPNKYVYIRNYTVVDANIIWKLYSVWCHILFGSSTVFLLPI